MSERVMIQSVDRAISILNVFSEDHPEWKLKEICEKLDLNKSTAHGILHTLKCHGLIAQDEETQKYRLGLKMLDYGYGVLRNMNLRELAVPVLKRISRESGESAILGVLEGGSVVYIERREASALSLQVSSVISAINPAYSSAVGRAILAFLPEEEQLSRLPETFVRTAKNSIMRREDLIGSLRATKMRGYSLVDEEFMDGVISLGAPIYNFEGEVIAAISIGGTVARITKERIDGIARLVCGAAEEISRELGHV